MRGADQETALWLLLSRAEEAAASLVSEWQQGGMGAKPAPQVVAGSSLPPMVLPVNGSESGSVHIGSGSSPWLNAWDLGPWPIDHTGRQPANLDHGGMSQACDGIGSSSDSGNNGNDVQI